MNPMNPILNVHTILTILTYIAHQKQASRNLNKGMYLFYMWLATTRTYIVGFGRA